MKPKLPPWLSGTSKSPYSLAGPVREDRPPSLTIRPGAARFGRRTPVPTSGPPRLPFSVGLHLWGCHIAKRGAPETDDSAAIQRIVELLSADPPPGFCRTVRKVASDLRSGDPQKHYSRLRKKYRRLEECGLLPPNASPEERSAEALKQAIGRRSATIEEARRQVVMAEERARATGLDLNANLDNLIADMIFRRRDMDDFLNDGPERHMRHFLEKGIKDPEAAAQGLIEIHRERRQLEEQFQALCEVRRLRDIARQQI